MMIFRNDKLFNYEMTRNKKEFIKNFESMCEDINNNQIIINNNKRYKYN